MSENMISDVMTFFTPKQLAKRWKVSDDTIRQWCAAGKLAAMQVGGSRGVLRIHESVVREHETAAVHQGTVEVLRARRRRVAVVDRVGNV